MKKTKLSPAQEKLIRAMQSGVKVYYIGGYNARCFMSDTMKNISWSTIHHLELVGLVVRDEKLRTLELTETGKTIQL